MTLRDASILVVDDEPVLRMTFSILLKQRGATVHTAGDGLDALDVLGREPVDLILTDRRMPRMDGTELLRALRQRRIPVPAVLFVNDADPYSADLRDETNLVETVRKPVHPETLMMLLEKVLSRIPVSRAGGSTPQLSSC